MFGRIATLICFLIILSLMGMDVNMLSADGDKGRHRARMRERHGRSNHDAMMPVNNPIYKNECGACHFVYQPELLPSASWKKLVIAHEDHFGEYVALDDYSERAILDYLTANSAEKSSAKRSTKIMRSLGNNVPSRITDIPYIKEKHRKISSSVLKRTSIGSLSNCSACHTTAEEGVYDDDNVMIPGQ